MLTVINLDDIEAAESKVNELVEKRMFMDALCALCEMEEKDRVEEVLKIMEIDELFCIRKEEKLKEYKLVIKSVLSQKGIGEIIEFGSYQNEPIKWRVLDKIGDKKLLISEQAIDCKPYHSKNEAITWEKCDLRKWLNEEFIESAFSEDEKGKIAESEIENNDNLKYDTKGGKNTKDKVFLLSIEEAYKYFADSEDRICKATDYAKKSGPGWWWLRSPGRNSYYAADVYYGGSVYEDGSNVDSDGLVVRPAFWINP